MPATFTFKTHLERAMRSHVGEKPLQVGIKLIGDSASAFGPPFRLQALHSDFMVVDREKSPETLVRYDGIAALTIIL
jgi:hypothetical protein